MAAKPMLFSTPMVRALLSGCKTETRRLVKPQPTNPRWNVIGWAGWDDGHGYRMKQPCQEGDILYVRETWYYEWHMHDRTAGEPDLPGGRYSQRYIFKADQPDYPVDVGVGPHGWKPCIHMPKEAARLFLRVKRVGLARLQDMTEEQCARDGGYAVEAVQAVGIAALFGELWDSTIKKSEDRARYGWAANPWVWVIEFERVSMEGGGDDA